MRMRFASLFKPLDDGEQFSQFTFVLPVGIQNRLKRFGLADPHRINHVRSDGLNGISLVP